MTEKLPPDALIEAALLTQTEPLSEKDMRELCVPPLSSDKLIDVLANLKARWHNRALQLVHTHEGWRFQIAQSAFERLGSLQEQRKPRKLSLKMAECHRGLRRSYNEDCRSASLTGML